MIWATVSSQSCFCWLYRASPSSAAKNIIKLILVLTIWWCPWWTQESSLELLEEGVYYDQCILLAKLCSSLPCFIFTPQPNSSVTPGISWLPAFPSQYPMIKRTSFLVLVLVLYILIELFNFSFVSIRGWGIDLEYCDIEWFVLETNRDHSVIFETASKYCISDSFLLNMRATPFLLWTSSPL